LSQRTVPQVTSDPLSNLRVLLGNQIDHGAVISLKSLLCVGDKTINQIETFGELRSLYKGSPVSVIDNVNSIGHKVLKSCELRIAVFEEIQSSKIVILLTSKV
jgi:hypothetical protein